MTGAIIIISLIRIASAYYMTVNPLIGLLIYWIFDYLDAWPLQQGFKMKWKSYQRWDKIVDFSGYAAMLYVGVINGYGFLFLLVVFYRIFGSVIFLIWNKQGVLLLFPNLVEVVFIWAILLKGAHPGGYLPLLILIKEFQEYFLHIFWPKYLKTKGFPKFFNLFGARGKVDLS